NLQVLPKIQDSISQTICAGNAVNFCGIDRNQSGIYTCNLTAAGGCDSVVTLNLQVLPKIQDSISQTICAGNAVNFCGIDRDQSGIYSCNLTAAGGCDSVVTLNLTVNPKPVAGISAFPGTVVSCRNDTLQLMATGASGGSVAWSTGETAPFIYPSAGGTFSVTVTAGGCSDTASIEILEDKKRPAVSLSLSQPSIFCSGQTVVVTASSPDNPSYQWQGGPATGEQFPTNSAGLVFVKATTPNGCDTTLFINVPQAAPTTETFAETLCAGRCAVFADVERCATGIYRDTIRTVSGGCDSVLRTFNLVVLSAPVRRDTVRLCAGGATVFCDEKIYEPGTYDCLLETPGGCDTVLSRTVELLETPSLLANDDAALLPIGATELEIRPGENDLLPGDGNWSVALVGQPPKVGSVEPDGTGKQLIFRLEGPDFSGSDVFLYALCSATCAGVCDTAQVSLLLPNDDFDSVKKEYSNVVTPNDDGLNDRFVPMAAFQKQNIPVVEAQSELSVFNRWGELVFWADAPPLEWNGRDVDGTPMPQATYYFVLRASVQGRTERKVLAGAVTVLR
ncbi:MAG: gliding motility-associated C-terminal domain-containing protein, partial [Saprospiraceae bacterium]